MQIYLTKYLNSINTCINNIYKVKSNYQNKEKTMMNKIINLTNNQNKTVKYQHLIIQNKQVKII